MRCPSDQCERTANPSADTDHWVEFTSCHVCSAASAAVHISCEIPQLGRGSTIPVIGILLFIFDHPRIKLLGHR